MFYDKGETMKQPERFRGKNVLITGGSSGIGLETAVAFAGLGANLFLVARQEGRLKEAAEKIRSRVKTAANITIFPGDVGCREQIEAIVHEVGQKYGGLHTLINNAGVVSNTLLENTTVEELEQTMKVNYWGMVYALKIAWPYLKAAQNGHIGFVSSVAGFVGIIGYSGYSPSKFAMTGLAECVRMEARDYGIGVTIVFPPDTDTPMLQYENEHAIPECQALGAKANLMKPEVVARQFVDGILNYRFEVLCNRESKLIRLVRAIWANFYFHELDRIVAADRKKRGLH